MNYDETTGIMYVILDDPDGVKQPGMDEYWGEYEDFWKSMGLFRPTFILSVLLETWQALLYSLTKLQKKESPLSNLFQG